MYSPAMNRSWKTSVSTLAALLAMCFTACGNPSATRSDEAIEVKAADISAPVRLRLANGYEQHTLDTGGQCPCSYYSGMSGIIEVENLGYSKDVAVRLSDSSNHAVWRDEPARYFGPGPAGKDIFVFDVPRVSTGYNPADFTFAVRYTVGGTTYWDNNGGWNYRIKGPRYSGDGEAVLGTANVALGHAYLFEDAFSGAVLLKDLAYDKQVKVVYSMDGWKTTWTGLARYDHPGIVGQQWWNFSFPVPAGTKEVEFAVSYEVAGVTYWDNNQGANFHFNSDDGAYQFHR